MSTSEDTKQPKWTDSIVVNFAIPSGSTGGDVVYKEIPGGYWRVIGTGGYLDSATGASDELLIGKYDVASTTFSTAMRALSGSVAAGSTSPWGSQDSLAQLVITASNMSISPGDNLAVVFVTPSGTVASGSLDVILAKRNP